MTASSNCLIWLFMTSTPIMLDSQAPMPEPASAVARMAPPPSTMPAGGKVTAATPATRRQPGEQDGESQRQVQRGHGHDAALDAQPVEQHESRQQGPEHVAQGIDRVNASHRRPGVFRIANADLAGQRESAADQGRGHQHDQEGDSKARKNEQYGLAGIDQEVAIGSTVDSCVQEAMVQYDIPGLAVGILVDGEFTYERGYGVKHRDQGGAVDEHTLFRHGSVGKMLTAAAILRLVDQGAVDLNDPVTEWVAYLKDIGVRELRLSAASVFFFARSPSTWRVLRHVGKPLQARNLP